MNKSTYIVLTPTYEYILVYSHISTRRANHMNFFIFLKFTTSKWDMGSMCIWVGTSTYEYDMHASAVFLLLRFVLLLQFCCLYTIYEHYTRVRVALYPVNRILYTVYRKPYTVRMYS